MREWYVSKVFDVYQLQEELNSFESDDEYEVQQVLYVDDHYEILYTTRE